MAIDAYNNQTMRQDEEQPSPVDLEDFREVTPDEFYIHPLRVDNSVFYRDNGIIRNPDKVLSFFKQFDAYSLASQVSLLKELFSCLESVTTNARLLASTKDPSSGEELVEYILARILRTKSLEVRSLLQTNLYSILKSHVLSDRLIKGSLKQLVVDFYGSRVQIDRLLVTAQIFQSIYQNKVQRVGEPTNTMVFHGSNNNYLESQKNIGWIFGKGFTLAMWIYFQPIKSIPNFPVGKLFTFYAQGVGGLEAYLVNQKLYYRQIGPRYSEPQLMSTGTYMCQIEPHKWHFLAIQHEEPKTFSKSKVNVYLDKKLASSISIDPPKPNPTCPTKISFFNNMYCTTSPFCLYFSPVGTARVDELSRNINSIEYLKDSKALVFEESGGKLVERSGFGWIEVELIRKNRKIYSQHMLPFFYLLRFVQVDNKKPLNELLALVVPFLVLSKQNQQEAQSSDFFQMLGVLLCQINYDPSDDNTIKVLNSIKQSITDQKLLDRFFSQLLWKLLSSKLSIPRKTEIFTIIKSCFTQNLAHFSQLLGLDQILNLIVKFETRKIECCEKHQQAVGKLDKPFIESQQEHFLQNILQLVELLFMSPKIDMNIQLVKLMRLLVLKFSPCFQLTLIQLIKKIFIERLNDRTTEDSFRKVLKNLGSFKIHLLFLDLINGSQFVDVKAETLKLLFSLISWKISPVEEEEIAAYVSQDKFFKLKPNKDMTFIANNINELPPQTSSNSVLNLSPTKSFGQIPAGSPQQAPGVRNRPGRTFVFPDFNQPPIAQINEVEQQQKAQQPDNAPLILPSKNKKKLNLFIDTQEIQIEYDRQYNPTTVDEEAERLQVANIRQLARECLHAMRNEQVRQTVTRPAPLSVRQRKSFDFPGSQRSQPLPPMSTRNRDLPGRLPMSFPDLKITQESQQSASKKSSCGISIEQRTPKISPSQKNQQQNLVLLYTSLLEMVFQKNINKLLTPPPKIFSMNCLYILLSWTLGVSNQIKQFVMADLNAIAQSPVNVTLLSQSSQVIKFLVKMTQYALETNNTRIQSDSHELLTKIVTEMFSKNNNCEQKLLVVVNWPSRVHARYVWRVVLAAVQKHCAISTSNDSFRQKNFSSICLLTQQLIYYGGKDVGLCFMPPEELPQLMREVFSTDSYWVDHILVEQLLRIFNKYFASQAYTVRKRNGINQVSDKKFIDSVLNKSNQYSKQAEYYLGSKGQRGPLLALMSVYSSYIKTLTGDDVAPISIVEQLIALIKLLFVFPEMMTPKQFNEKRQQILQALAFALKTILTDQRGVPGLEVFNYIVMLKCQMKKRLAHLGGDSAPSYLNNLIGDFLNVYFSHDSQLFQLNKYDSNMKELSSLAADFPDAFPSKRPFDQEQFEFNLIKLQLKVKQKYQDDTYFFITSTIENQKDRQDHISLLQEVYERKLKRKFKSVWKKLRLYDSIWAHPSFYFQNDQLFSKTAATFDRVKSNEIYELRIDKQESKNRAHFLLSTRLKQPSIVRDYQGKNPRKQGATKLTDTFRLISKTMADENKLLSLNQGSIEFYSRWKGEDLQLRKVQLVNTLTVKQGSVAITNENILFLHQNYAQQKSHLCMLTHKISYDSALSKQWPLQYIKQIQLRRYVNKRTAIEIFLVTGKSIFLNFPDGDAELFSKRLIRMRNSRCPNLLYNKTLEPKKIIDQGSLTKRWNTFNISNFEYLMLINSLSGRSYRDVSQYPVFPWVVTSFAQRLDINSTGSYRDLKKNMGCLGSENRVSHFQQKYSGLDPNIQQHPFHYGTHYSSPGIIYHYLIRLPPFTQGAIELQSGHFDFADRMFYSIQDSYRNCTTQQSDVRQLVPEFYTLPEIFLNSNRYDFGCMQNTRRVHNVELPLWARDNPYFYVSRLRRAIQSNYVSGNINNWIDLIFGYKQKGIEARKSLNVFINVTYEDTVNFQTLNIKEKLSVQTQILNFGQTPSQVFTRPHPVRSNSIITGMILGDQIQTKVYRPSKKHESLRPDLNPMMFGQKAIIKLKEINENSKETKLVCIHRNGTLINYKWSTQTQSNIPFQCCIESEKKFQRINKEKFDPNEFYDWSLNPESFPIQTIREGEIVLLGGLHQGKLVALSSDDIHPQTQVYRFHHQTISVLKCDSKDKFLISGDIGGDVILWRISNHGKLMLSHKYSDHSGAVTSIFISEDLRLFATSSMDGSVHVYNIITGKKVRSYFHPERKPLNNVVICTSPLASIILFCSLDRMILSYSINGQLLKRVTEKYSHIFVPCILKDHKGLEYLAYGSQKGQVVLRETPFLDNPKVFTVAKDAAVTGICLSKDLRFLICCCSDGQLSVVAPDLRERTNRS